VSLIARQLLLPVGLAVWSCGSPVESPAPGVVATIDSTRIYADDLRRFAERAPASGETPEALRQSYLRGLVATHLMVQEALARGLDTTSSVRRKIDSQRRSVLLDRYRQRVVLRDLQPTERQVQAFFDSLELGRQRRVSGILVDSPADARVALSLLRMGRSFAEVALQRSIHEESAQQGGVLGYVSLPQARTLGIPDSLYRSLPDGEPSPVLPNGDRWQVVLFDGERRTEVEEHRTGILLHLREQLEQQREREYAEELARRLRWRLNSGALQLMLTRRSGDGTVRPWQLSGEESAEPLFVFDGGFVSTGEYLETIWSKEERAATGWGQRDSLSVLAAGETLRTDRLFYAEAMRLGLDEGLDEYREAQRRQQMVIELRRQVLQERVGMPTPAEALQYYEANPDVFRQGEQIIVREAHVATRAAADSLRREVEAGTSFPQIAAAHPRHDDGLLEPGMVQLGEYERIALAELYKAALEAEPGVLVGPVAAHDGYSLVQVLGRQPGPLQPFSQAQRRATSLLKSQRERIAFDAFVEDLLERHADRLDTYPESLRAALPDTLIRRLADATG
jgi:parvulin-like peptidyl-prolyl isomerase